MADGSLEAVEGEAHLPLTIKSVCKSTPVLVIPTMPTELLLGLDVIRQFGIDILGSRDTFRLADLGDEVEFPFRWCQEDLAVNEIDVSSVGLAHLTEEQRAEVNALLDELLPEHESKSKRLNQTDLIEHEIVLKPEARPVKQRGYPVSEKMEQNIQAQLDTLIEQDVVEPSFSEWNNPVVMVKKSSGEYRMCIDFRQVNDLSKKDSYSTPHMESILNKLKRARYITTIDLKSAFHNIPLRERSKEVTAFTIPGRECHLVWLRLALHSRD